jgi:hypothetical protein
MSNPYKRYNHRRNSSVRPLLIIFGGGAVIFGFYEFLHGHTFYGQYEPQLGTLGSGYTLTIGFVGLIMFVAGLIFRWEKRK